jgi:hypothetical protein
VDIDQDGRRDILSGSYSRMTNDMAGLFQVLRGKTDGTFHKAEVLNGIDGEPLIIPVHSKPGKGDDWINNICTRPFAVDWNGDGHLDLVVGTFPGSFYLFKGEGKGKFLPKPDEMKADGKPLRIDGHHSDPFIIDWDGDGDLDILSGASEGGVQWAENRAGPGKPPQLNPFRPLINSGPKFDYGQILHDEDLKGPTTDTRIWVDDVNLDGKLDILVGDRVSLVAPADGLSEKEFKERSDSWTKESNEASQRLQAVINDEKERPKAQQRVQELYQQRTKFIKEDMTGFVWLYLQK